jgi:hypothetical protein
VAGVNIFHHSVHHLTVGWVDGTLAVFFDFRLEIFCDPLAMGLVAGLGLS